MICLTDWRDRGHPNAEFRSIRRWCFYKRLVDGNAFPVLFIPHLCAFRAKLDDGMDGAPDGFRLPRTVIDLRLLLGIIWKEHLRVALRHGPNDKFAYICKSVTIVTPACDSMCLCIAIGSRENLDSA